MLTVPKLPPPAKLTGYWPVLGLSTCERRQVANWGLKDYPFWVEKPSHRKMQQLQGQLP
jgi:hypothetical protein